MSHVFADTKREANSIAEILRDNGFEVIAINNLGEGYEVVYLG